MEVFQMENKNSSLKTLLIVVGAIVCVGTAVALLYTFFKKHFKVTFACDGCEDCDCECCDCFDEDFAECADCVEPVCCEEECTCEDCADAE